MDVTSNVGHSRIIAFGTDLPLLRMKQSEVLADVLKYHKVSPRAAGLYERFFGDHGIHTRHFGFERVSQVFEESYDQAMERFQATAVNIGSGAAANALSEADLCAHDISALIVTTCTGYLCPGLATYIAERLGLKPDVFLLDLVGQGCGAAGPALRAADHFLKAHPQARALVVCVEVCSSAFSDGEKIDLLISNAIFGDGAAAAVVSCDQQDAGLEIQNFQSLLRPEYREDLRFQTRQARLCNVISKRVPELAASAVEDLRSVLIGELGECHHYAFHTGGRVVLDSIQQALGLDEGQMVHSRSVLKDYGNMSSPSILFVLKRLWESGDLQFHQRIFVFTFGAGFSAHGFSAIFQPGVCHDNVHHQQRFFKITVDQRG